MKSVGSAGGDVLAADLAYNVPKLSGVRGVIAAGYVLNPGLPRSLEDGVLYLLVKERDTWVCGVDLANIFSGFS